MTTGIAICTCPREPAYIHQTLAALHLGGLPSGTPIHLMMDSEDDYLPYDYPQLIKCLRTGPKGSGPATRNYIRCLELASKYDSLLVLEDDVLLRHGWVSVLNQVISRLNGPYVFSLHGWTPSPSRPAHVIRRDDGLVEIGMNKLSATSWSGFLGTFAMYYPGCVIPELLKTMRLYVESTGSNKYDTALALHCEKYDVPIITLPTASPGFVDHVGVHGIAIQQAEAALPSQSVPAFFMEKKS